MDFIFIRLWRRYHSKRPLNTALHLCFQIQITLLISTVKHASRASSPPRVAFLENLIQIQIPYLTRVEESMSSNLHEI